MGKTSLWRRNKRLAAIKRMEPSKACSTCEGKCCKHLPGLAAPIDFHKLTAEAIAERLKTGLWCLDYWEGETPIYFPRPAIKGHEGVRKHGAWCGECVFLGPPCKLSLQDRPFECATLVPRPKEGDDCKVKWTKKDARDAWEPYQELLKNALELGGNGEE